MACNCAKNRTVSGGGSRVASSGTPDTYRVMVGTRKVYETTNPNAAEGVAARFDGAKILAPGQAA